MNQAEKNDARGDVAVFIDFENIWISVRERYSSNPNFESIMEAGHRYGRVTIARAYADWYRYPRITNALYANAIEPMYVPTYHYSRERGRTGGAIKNSVDMHLCIDMMKALHAYENIDTYVLVTGDRDFIPLLNAIRQQGKQTVVIGVADATASHLAQAADKFFYYNQVDEDIADGGDSGDSQDPYDVLIEAVKLARKRGQVTTLGTLKLLMLELMPKFDEGNYKDSQGRSFSKFKAFIKEAERRNKVKIFASGSIREVLLPSEDPYEVSQFAPEPSSKGSGKRSSGRDNGKRSGGGSGSQSGSGEERRDGAANTEEDDDPFSDTDWAVFEEAMKQMDEKVLFIQIYDALRDLRNKEIIDLSNTEIKRLIKLAINEGLLRRDTRGPHAYYEIEKDRPFRPAS